MIDNSRTLKNEYKISNNKYKSHNQKILLSTKIDYRHTVWCAGLPEKSSKNIYIGLHDTKKLLIYTEAKIDIIHYKLLDNESVNKSSSLYLVKCTGCYTGVNKNGHCVISLEKKYSTIIKSKVTNREDENKKKIKVIDQMITDLIIDIKNLVKEQEIPSNIIHIEVDKDEERNNLIDNILGYSNSLSPSAKWLSEIYRNNKCYNRTNYIFYTDGLLKKYEDRVDMGIGWIKIENEIEIHKFNAKTKGWPSSTRAEIIAILTTLLVVKKHSVVNIYTDSKNTISIFNSYKAKFSNYKSYVKLDNQIVWELILKVIMHKVKAHSNNKWNDRADEEANEGRDKDTLLLIKNSYSKHKYQMQYYGINIDTNPRSFIKKMNDIHIQKDFDNLNINSKFSIAEVDKKLSLKIIKEKYQKKGITMSRFRNFKDHNLKAFNVKKLMDELPTLENLKKRRPDLYAENLKCIR